jgi:hypothetical protein
MARIPLFRLLIRVLQKADSQKPSSQGTIQSPLKRTLWTRRRFLKAATLASSLTIAVDTLPYLKQTWSSSPPSVVVVGVVLQV